MEFLAKSSILLHGAPHSSFFDSVRTATPDYISTHGATRSAISNDENFPHKLILIFLAIAKDDFWVQIFAGKSRNPKHIAESEWIHSSRRLRA
jgi:hypothetical protein